jgi:TonB-dependent receptor
MDIPASALRGTTNLSMGGINTNILSWDVPSILGLYTQKARNPWDAKDNNYAVHEKVTTAFGKLNIDTEMGSTPVRGNVGIQIVRTQQNSDGFAWNDGGSVPGGAAVVPVSGGANYTDVLPSLNLVFSMQPDLIARVGLSKAMARPRMDDLRAGADQPKLKEYASPLGYGAWSAGNGGKPDLEPWRAKAFDLSLEKYFGKSSYVAAAGFYKFLDSFIYTQDTQRDFTGFPNYSNLIPACPISNPGCNPNVGTITTMDNGQGGKVWGVELAASLEGALLSPALQGFGVIASQAFTWNSLPNDKNGDSITLDGFSAVVNNITLYYEKDGFSSRISRRYRAPFTSSTRSVQLATETSVKYDEESQVDLQLGYSWEQGSLKGLSVLFQVNNLTDPATVNYKSSEIGGANSKGLVPWRYVTYGRSSMLGVTYKF